MFLQTIASLRLSDLLRLMLSCTNAMVLTDKSGYIIHCNKEWCFLTGYCLREVEGKQCGSILHGTMTDIDEVYRCELLHNSALPSIMTIVNYRKDGLMFVSTVTTSPVRGAYMSDGK